MVIYMEKKSRDEMRAVAGQISRLRQLSGCGAPLVYPSGKNSFKELTRSEANAMIANMEQRFIMQDKGLIQ